MKLRSSVKWGGVAIPELKKALKSTNSTARNNVLRIITYLGDEKKELSQDVLSQFELENKRENIWLYTHYFKSVPSAIPQAIPIYMRLLEKGGLENSILSSLDSLSNFIDFNPHPSLSNLKGIKATGERVADGEQGYWVWPEFLFPLGFSSDSLFAYLVYHENGFCGVCPRLKIIDLVKDEIKVDRSYEGVGGNSPQESMEKLAENRGYSLTYYLDKFNISPINNAQIQKFPLMIKGDEFNAKFVNIFLTKYKKGSVIALVLKSDYLGLKKVSEKEWYMSNTSKRPTIEGFIKSPFENRIAIILSQKQYILEHEWEIAFHIYGAHLKVGFKN